MIILPDLFSIPSYHIFEILSSGLLFFCFLYIIVHIYELFVKEHSFMKCPFPISILLPPSKKSSLFYRAIYNNEEKPLILFHFQNLLNNYCMSTRYINSIAPFFAKLFIRHIHYQMDRITLPYFHSAKELISNLIRNLSIPPETIFFPEAKDNNHDKIRILNLLSLCDKTKMKTIEMIIKIIIQ